MSQLAAFLNFDRTEKIESLEKEIIVTKRIKDENGKPIKWKIRAIPQDINLDLVKKHTRDVMMSGQVGEKLDTVNYQAELMVESVVFPDLKNSELCKKYGIMNPIDLPKVMLLPAEYIRLAEAIKEINGFYENYDDDDFEIAKNSLTAPKI